MIKTVKISNFKSVQDLEIELGRLNVFIGENGCGKTSILEGIAMGSAAAQDKLDNEFLVSRGIRVSDSALMKSAFSSAQYYKEIFVEFSSDEPFKAYFHIDKTAGLQEEWKYTSNFSGEEAVRSLLNIKDPTFSKQLSDQIVKGVLDSGAVNIEKNIYNEVAVQMVLDSVFKKALEDATASDPSKLSKIFFEKSISSFLLFAPENYFLRRFEEEGQISPLGIRGEGLFRHLVELSKEAPETFKAIADNLSLIDWYGGFAIPNDLQFTERRIAITDRFIADTIKDFDQRSANEGFLYLLFYFTLFLSKWTPKFFAIDNVDNALNPRLCSKLVEVLAKLSKEQDKQAILTTHNPAILDGLDLNDDEQRLFVIYRNADGATQARRIKPLQSLPGVEPVRLSEAFVRGYLGGLPKNF